MRSAIEMICRPCSAANACERGEAGHRAVVVHDLGEHAGRVAARRGGPGRRPPRCGRPASARRPRGSGAGRCGRAARGPRAGWPGRGAPSRSSPGRARRCRWSCRARASTETVNAVRCDSVLFATMSGSDSSSRRGPSTGMQITPLVWRIMNAIGSGVTLLGGHDEVALVLAVGVVDDDDELAAADGVDGRARCVVNMGATSGGLPG